MIFNKLYSLGLADNQKEQLIICCGGKTDMIAPYKRTEAGEMIWFFKEFTKYEHLKNITKKWKYIGERISLSTLENLLNSKEILNKKGVKKGKINIFCEFTRRKRITKLAKVIFGKDFEVKVIPIDFDTSLLRYTDPAFLSKKEKMGLKSDLWALQSEENLKEYKKLFRMKIKRFRNAKKGELQKVIAEYWKEQIDLSKK